jgi:DNA replication initiation complex subunit (GINS family)
MITYKELRNFQRLERENNDLQELGESFVTDVLHYLNEKREALKSSKEKDSIFSKDAQNEIRNELRNAIVVIQDIYERRERKILGQAVLAVKTDSSIQDTTRMLDFEKQMYTDMIDLLRGYREKFFGQRKEKVREEMQPEERSETQPEVQILSQPEKQEIAPAQPESPSELQTIKIIQDVPQFVWEDGKTYGPFKKEDVANLDTKLASMLVSRGSAEIL